MEKRILILGASGFIGDNLSQYLRALRQHKLIVCHHSSELLVTEPSMGFLPNYAKCDLTDKTQVEALFEWAKPHVVIHAAAVTTGAKDTLEQPWLHVTDNVRMNALVMEACHRHEVEHCVWFSCTVMYQPKDTPQKETDWVDGEELYHTYFGVGNMKVYTEKLCQFYSRLGKCKYTAIRHSNVYGPGDKFDLDKCHMLPALVKKVCDLPDEGGELEVWGNGQARRDLIYIDDLVDFVHKVITYQTAPYELFNCGAGQAYTIKSIIDELRVITEKKFDIRFNTNKPDIPTVVMLDCTKAKEQLGWEPIVSLHDGLIKTVEHYRSLCTESV